MGRTASDADATGGSGVSAEGPSFGDNLAPPVMIRRDSSPNWSRGTGVPGTSGVARDCAGFDTTGNGASVVGVAVIEILEAFVVVLVLEQAARNDDARTMDKMQRVLMRL